MQSTPQHHKSFYVLSPFINTHSYVHAHMHAHVKVGANSFVHLENFTRICILAGSYDLSYTFWTMVGPSSFDICTVSNVTSTANHI